MNEAETRAEHIDPLENLIAYCREQGRVCPVPPKWNDLWDLLPERHRVGGGWQPSAPLILAAWADTSNLQKMLRLAEQIRWAAGHGGLPVVAAFLYDLTELDWHHLND